MRKLFLPRCAACYFNQPPRVSVQFPRAKAQRLIFSISEYVAMSKRHSLLQIARVTKTFATDQTRILTDRTMRAESSVGGMEIGERSSSAECSSTGGVRGPNPCRSVTIRGKISGGFCGVRLSGLQVQQTRSPRIKHGFSRIGQCAPRALLEARKSAAGLRVQSVHPPEEFEVPIRADP
jgi:hypothetical protein